MGASTLDSLHQVLILGAGPAGLTLAGELQRRGLPCLVLEQAGAVANSWRQMPTNLKLVSPWKANALPGFNPRSWPRHATLTRAEYGDYLQAYARERALPVRTGVVVRTVERAGGGRFVVRTSAGDFTARFLVNATGCFSHPFLPEIPGAQDSSIFQCHFANYGDPDQLRARLRGAHGPVLVVGQRLSAGQVMTELADAGFSVALSHRRTIRFGPGPLGWWIFFRVHPWLEAFRLWRHGAKARGFDAEMMGGRPRQLLRSGRVPTFPPIRCFEGDTVIFQDGRTLKPSAIVYATGFRPALKHLAALVLEETAGSPVLRELESVSEPGLFFLGLDHARNFQSRFLRGIRNDAAFLAARLEKRLAGTGPIKS